MQHRAELVGGAAAEVQLVEERPAQVREGDLRAEHRRDLAQGPDPVSMLSDGRHNARNLWSHDGKQRENEPTHGA